MAHTTQPAVTLVGELGLRPVVSVTPDTALDQAARVMRAHDVSSLVVGEHGGPASIVTELADEGHGGLGGVCHVLIRPR